MIKELIFHDWKGNEINYEDTVKLICIEEPTCEILHAIEKNHKDKKSYLIPNLYDITKPINHYSLLPKKPGHKNVFKTVASYCVNSIGGDMIDGEPVTIPHLSIGKSLSMCLRDFIEVKELYMQNCIIAIEGKSDNEGEFYEKYFEL